jgi:hypothetical protein
VNFDDLKEPLRRLKASNARVKEHALITALEAIIENEDTIIVAASVTPRGCGTLPYLLNVLLAGEKVPPDSDHPLFGEFASLLVNCMEVYGVPGVLYCLSSRYSTSSWPTVVKVTGLKGYSHINVQPDWSKSTMGYLDKELCNG